jgi:hypothetical protein
MTGHHHTQKILSNHSADPHHISALVVQQIRRMSMMMIRQKMILKIFTFLHQRVSESKSFLRKKNRKLNKIPFFSRIIGI